MNLRKKFKNDIILQLIILLVFSFTLFAKEVKIISKVNNEIITNIDVEEEYKYLITLNKSLKEINKDQVLTFAKDSLVCRVSYHSKRLGLKFGSLSVRDQSSRWGSCSARRGISLNWRLLLLSPALQDYIILHELAHLSEMNHSKRFWSLLDHYDPLRVVHEAELDQISAKLMRVGRSALDS